MMEDGPTTRCFENNTPTTAMIDPKDGLKNHRLHNNSNNNATATVTEKSVDMLTESTASTSNIANNGTATAKQTQQIPGNTAQQNPSPTTHINTALKHSENPT
jgi:hypothetical protein